MSQTEAHASVGHSLNDGHQNAAPPSSGQISGISTLCGDGGLTLRHVSFFTYPYAGLTWS